MAANTSTPRKPAARKTAGKNKAPIAKGKAGAKNAPAASGAARGGKSTGMGINKKTTS